MSIIKNNLPNEKLLNKLGIQVKNPDGTYRKIEDILIDMSTVWQKIKTK